MLRKKFLLPVMVVTIGSAALFGASQVSAQNSDGRSEIVTMIAQKFNLDQSQVQQVFDQHKEQMHQKMQQKLEDRLNQLVKDGKLTETQKQAIIAKMNQEKSNFKPESMKDLTPEQRKEKMGQHRQEMEDWAKAQGIDLSLIKPLKMGRGMHGMH
jgi:Spy/CpxP family protein refolding chaperone